MQENVLTHVLSQPHIFKKNTIYYMYLLTSEHNYYVFISIKNQAGQNRYAYGCNSPVAQFQWILLISSQGLFLLNLTFLTKSQWTDNYIQQLQARCHIYGLAKILLQLPDLHKIINNIKSWQRQLFLCQQFSFHSFKSPHIRFTSYYNFREEY